MGALNLTPAKSLSLPIGVTSGIPSKVTKIHATTRVMEMKIGAIDDRVEERKGNPQPTRHASSASPSLLLVGGAVVFTGIVRRSDLIKCTFVGEPKKGGTMMMMRADDEGR